ncbi:transporter [Fictibacillus phosphorivorans]|uniref:transporter n=1 Tax=Fictibacillus phosphorivorans TaxID=1221500 RepID=UPI00129375D5|nr:transporter [Fictibacillus phosphorivorans]MQR96854.1 transporter [Fictibacillus phosphorivorans]
MNRSFPPFPGQGGGQGFGPPGGPPPGGPPGGGGGGGMAPTSAPPSFTPSQAQGFSMHGGGGGGSQPGVYAVDPGAISHCLYQYVYIWPTWGPGFWAWLTFVGRRSVAGYRWTGNRWIYFGMDTRQISSFYCY